MQLKSGRVFICDTGAPGEGKSLLQARRAQFLYERNRAWYKESGILRQIAPNQPLNASLLGEGAEKFFLPVWNDLSELCKLRDCDILWDEAANEIDARNFAMLSGRVKKFLSRFDKRGIEIYANTQDFNMLDKRARTMMSNVYIIHKVLGSRRPSNTRPKIEKPWGFYWVSEWENFRDEKSLSDESVRETTLWPEEYFWMQPLDIQLYDTHFETGEKCYPPLEHVEQECEKHGDGCSFRKTSHL